MRKSLFLTIIFLLLFALCSCDNNSRSPLDNDESSSNEKDIVYDADAETSDDDSEQIDDPFTTDSDSTVTDNENDTTPDEDNISSEYSFHSDFIEIPSISYTYNNESLTTDKAQIWYHFEPANKNPETAPLFIFFNGGPGGSTGLLLGYNTAKMTADDAYVTSDEISNNPYSWTKMGNLMFIDARQTGFSYSENESADDENYRSDAFSYRNFNVHIDAGDFIRTILGFFKKYHGLEKNKIYLVGESYGGTRATLMLSYFLNFNDYASGSRVYKDADLFEDIKNHITKVFPNENIDSISKTTIATHIAGEILIQPLVLGMSQSEAAGNLLAADDSPIRAVAQDLGVSFNPRSTGYNAYSYTLSFLENNDRDIYCFNKPYNWLFDYTDIGISKLTVYDHLKTMTKAEPLDMTKLYAENRTNAYRFVNELVSLKKIAEEEENIPEAVKKALPGRTKTTAILESDLEDYFGNLKFYDMYYVGLNRLITNAFYSAAVTPYSDGIGDVFLDNIKYIPTFITNAGTDVVIYAPAIPEAIKSWDGVSNVAINSDNFVVSYSDGSSATVKFPYYDISCHSVSVLQPEELFMDVFNWLGYE